GGEGGGGGGGRREGCRGGGTTKDVHVARDAECDTGACGTDAEEACGSEPCAFGQGATLQGGEGKAAFPSVEVPVQDGGDGSGRRPRVVRDIIGLEGKGDLGGGGCRSE